MSNNLKDSEILKKYKGLNHFKNDAEFARSLGVSRQSMSRWMRGLTAVSDLLLITWSQDASPRPQWVKKMATELIVLHTKSFNTAIPMSLRIDPKRTVVATETGA